MCKVETKEDWDFITDLNRLVVLSFFHYDVVDENGQKVKVTGFVFTSKKIMNNGYHAYITQNEEGIVLNVDGP